jgi:hypothetical protein
VFNRSGMAHNIEFEGEISKGFKSQSINTYLPKKTHNKTDCLPKRPGKPIIILAKSVNKFTDKELTS